MRTVFVMEFPKTDWNAWFLWGFKVTFGYSLLSGTIFNSVSANIWGKQRILIKYFVDEINYKNIIKIIETIALYVSRTARYLLPVW